MINLELYFNGLKAEFTDAEPIAASYSLNTLGKIKNRQGAKTNTYILPFSNYNKRIFENSEIINNDTELPYTLMEHYAYIEGIEVFSGFAKIESAKEGYEVIAFSGNSDFFTAIKDKSIRELDLSDLNHIRNEANIQDSWSNTDGYIYAFMDYGKYKTLPLSATSQPYIMPHDLYPAVYFKTILERIALEAGYILQGDVLRDTKLLNSVIPFQYSKEDNIDYGIKATRQPKFSFPTGGGLIALNVNTDPFNAYDETDLVYVSPVSQVVTIRFTFAYFMDDFEVAILHISKREAGNTNFNFSFTGGQEIWVAGLPKGATEEKIVEINNVGLLEGEQLFIQCIRSGGKMGFEFKNFEIVTEQVLNNFGKEWDVAANLPDIKQDKFFLDFLMQYNIVPDTDYNEGVIRLEYFDSIENKEPVDWSKKIDRTENPKIYYKFNDYARINTLKYKTDDVITDGNSYDFLINNKTLEQSKTEFESQFFLPPMDFIFGGYTKVLSPKILTIKEGLSFKGIWDSTISYLTDDVVYIAATGSWHIAKQASTNQNPLTASSSYWRYGSEPDIWNITPRNIIGVVESQLPITVKFSSGDVDTVKFITSTGLDWPTIWSEYYKVFSSIIDKTKIIEILIKLNHSDINQLDLTRPVYIDDYNSLFYCDEVMQFKLNMVDSTICRLIRL